MRAYMHELVCYFNAQSAMTIDRQKLSNCPTKYHIAPQSTCLPKASVSKPSILIDIQSRNRIFVQPKCPSGNHVC